MGNELEEITREKNELLEVCFEIEDKCADMALTIMNLTDKGNINQNKLEKIIAIIDSKDKNVFRSLNQIKIITEN